MRGTGVPGQRVSRGIPWSLNTLSTRFWAVSEVVGNFSRAMKWAAFENLSTIVRMTLFPEELGPVTKSNVI